MTQAARDESTTASNLELNKGDNFIFLVDVSGSMQTKDCPGGMSRIDFLKEKVIQFVGEAAKYDPDGVDLITFGHQVGTPVKVDAANASSVVGKLTAPEGATMTHLAIRAAWDIHKKGGYEQSVAFVATDGAPSDADAVRVTIREIAASVKDPREFCISFLTVGVIEPGLRAFLTELDDSLNAKHDIVDVKALTEVDFLSAFVGAIND